MFIFTEHIRKLTIEFLCLFEIRLSKTFSIFPFQGWNTPSEAVRSGSALFAQTCLSKYLMVVVIIADKIARVDIKIDKVSGA